jgi:hypothetical protein
MEEKKMKTIKRWDKKAMLTVTCATLATMMLLTVGAWSAFAGEFFATGRTVAENEAIWGNPSAIQTFNDGMEKRFYKYTNPIFFGYRSFVYKDGKAIDDGGLAVSPPEPTEGKPDYKVVITDYRHDRL